MYVVYWIVSLLLIFHMYCVCWCDLDLIQSQGQDHRSFELPTFAHNCTFLALFPLPFSRGAQNWWLLVIVWDLAYSLLSPIFEFPFRKAITTVHTSRNVDISQNSNSHILVLRQVVGYAGSTTGIVHADMTLTQSKVKVKVTGIWTSNN